MSTSVYFHGIVEPNEEFKKKYMAFVACQDAGVDPPDELWDYFNGDRPNPSGLVVRIESREVQVSKYQYVQEIDLKSLRPDISKIQIYVG